ncbi:MAG: MBOAT family protein [Candidatus Delongbacteria bacterium]|nr:MBOAT family protein [Candidatus Delongbacteria bacterium]
MFFNSIDFAIFLPLVFFLYWFVFNKNLRFQNLLIVISSYVFYGWWDWRFLSLILFSTVIDYIVGLKLKREKKSSKRLFYLWTSIFVNIGFLGFFKYYNFFIDNFIEAYSLFGKEISPNTLNIILPVGISFYTFQTLSYSIDVYRNKLEPTSDFIAFSAFVSFFPQLVAGPIERATHLLPQFYVKRNFIYSNAVLGLRQILWGLFKKIVIADNCAKYANMIFNDSLNYSGSALVLGAVFFAFQIYGDFSGYSDIAIGTSKLFGFDLMRNFAYPYFSRDIAEFWRRWHISLSTWFRDYLYIPLGGSKGSLGKKVRNTFIIFVVSGFWHGANWTFIVWGALNAIYFLPLLLSNQNRKNIGIVAGDKILPNLKEISSIVLTFVLTTFAWIFFRAESVSHAFGYIRGIFSKSLFEVPDLPMKALTTLVLIAVFIMIEWFGRKDEFAIADVRIYHNKLTKYAFYYTIVISIYLFGNFSDNLEFIYFQF